MAILETLLLSGLCAQSLSEADGVEFGLTRDNGRMQLAVLAPSGATCLAYFEGEAGEQAGRTLLLGPATEQNAAALRACLPWLRPQTLGLQTSAGLGDRLGLATPGHIAALRATGGAIAPIFAQQSIREMVRTGRSPQQVMDDATWGIFQEGWHTGAGADADHLKNTGDIDACLAAGFTFFTIDPGDHVDNSAQSASPAALAAAAERLPAEVSPAASGLQGRVVDVEGRTFTFDELTLLRAAVKYGGAVAHVAALYRHLIAATGGRNCELEVSVDETELPTSHAEHIYVASELRRLGVHWVSLAPRYIGRFEKGVDYIGDLAAFEEDFAIHAAIARAFGPYKLSLHSGSDKYSVYSIAARHTRGLVHLKTAGTSYLEALRTIAGLDPAFFREIYAFARGRYDQDKASYHVSAELNRAPEGPEIPDTDLPALLQQFDAREICHVTFGSVLTARNADGSLRFHDRLFALLRANPAAYAANLEAHFIRHLQPLLAR